MKLSEQWLREWVNPSISLQALCQTLTMAGLSVESCTPVEQTKNVNKKDFIVEFELTPNRSDCLSVHGIAREIALLTDCSPAIYLNQLITQKYYSELPLLISLPASDLNITLHSPENCPRYQVCLIKNFTSSKTTPEYIQHRLNKSGIKIIHPIVDILNYVMLEVGQPLHAFDADKLDSSTLTVRQALAGEKIILLDNQALILSPDVLIIADKYQAHALAGIMGGLHSAVSQTTKAIIIESAFFTPDSIAGRARRYGLHTEASHRFERGVDPALTDIALKYAVKILNTVYPDLVMTEIKQYSHQEYLPVIPEIILRYSRIKKVLGLNISPERIQKILAQLEIKIIDTRTDSLIVQPPSYRFDLKQEIDLIEEIIRIYGYCHIPLKTTLPALNKIFIKPDKLLNLKTCLFNQGFQEVINYSFISEKMQRLLDPEKIPLKLTNPLSAELAVMRTTLWAGLIENARYNINRQQDYLRLFEEGLCFIDNLQQSSAAGILVGQAFAEQWGEKKRAVDFFDMKNILEKLLASTHANSNYSNHSAKFNFTSGHHAALHPGQTAVILKSKKPIGICGALHPHLQQLFELNQPVFLFELNLNDLFSDAPAAQRYESFSKFPAIRRDIALLVNHSVSVHTLKKIIQTQAGLFLENITIFDLYQDKKLAETGQKSIAIGLTFQCKDRTLSEFDIQALMKNIITALTELTGVTLRE